jgi:hypothetical protein
MGLSRIWPAPRSGSDRAHHSRGGGARGGGGAGRRGGGGRRPRGRPAAIGYCRSSPRCELDYRRRLLALLLR